MSTNFEIVLLGKVGDVIASGEVKVSVTLRNCIHLATVLGGDNRELSGNRIFVWLVILKRPIVNGTTDEDTSTFGCFFESW